MDRPKRQRNAGVKLHLSDSRDKIAKKDLKKPRAVKSASHNKKSQSTKQPVVADISNDEIYNQIVAAQKQEKKDRKSKLKAAAAAASKIKSSTPTQTRKNRKRPVSLIAVSPIGLSESNTNLTNIDDEDSLLLPRKKITYEKENSNVRELKDMLAEFRINRELSALNATDNSSNSIGSILRELENNRRAKASTSSFTKKEEEEPKANELPDAEISDLNVTEKSFNEEENVIAITSSQQSKKTHIAPEIRISSHDESQSNTLYADIPNESEIAHDASEVVEGLPSIRVSLAKESNDTCAYADSEVGEDQNESAIIHLPKTQISAAKNESNASAAWHDDHDDTANESEINDQPKFLKQRLTLKPGKWRQSLVKWRRSNLPALSQKRRTSRRFEGLFPIKTAPKILNALEEDIEESAVLLEQSDEGLQIPGELSILDSSVECASLQEPTTFVDQRKTYKRETSVFKRTSIFYGLQSPCISDIDVVSSLSAKQIVLRRCGQQEPLLFDDIYSESQLPNCKKIGEGVYGEVFCYKSDDVPIVLKIIPIEGDLLVNGEQQKRYDEILSEIVISMELSGLRTGNKNVTDGFVNVKRVTCVKGAYPQHLIDEWEIYNDSCLKGSENDHPEVFGEDQLYVVFELCNAGIDLEAYQFKHAEEAFSVFLQVALTLAVAEKKFEFEHRDLHWGNILVAKTSAKFAEYCVDGEVFKVPTHGVKATIIDYTLSRMVYDGAVLYNNLADDEELFSADGDYQFDIYRFMRDRVKNDFKRFEPFTNILWLHYLLDKLIDGARYKYSKSDKHKSAVNKMMQLRDELLEYQSASEYVDSFQNNN